MATAMRSIIYLGVTAGIETTRVAPIWLEKANMMDKVVTISEFAKVGIYKFTVYDGHTQSILENP